MNQPDPNKVNRQQFINMTMIGLASQIGCLTVVILFAALFGGLWLDKTFDSKPIFTIFLVIVSAPLALGLTFWVAMRAARKVSTPAAGEQDSNLSEEEKSSE